MAEPTPGRTRRVVIIGGGFGGLYAAQGLSRANVEVTLIDRRNFHLFQPLLYQVATGGLSPANIAAPLRSILSRQRNVRVILGEVTDFALTTQEVILADGERIPFDDCILATGATHHYFGRDDWEPWAAGVKATPLNRKLAEAIGPEAVQRLGRAGHWPVNPDCSLADYPQIYAIGDCASYPGADGQPLPGVAPVAMQQGKYVARVLAAKAAGRPHPGPFRYWDKGSMATIGRNRAVAVINGFKLTGFLAWLAWLFIHVLYLAKFSNRVLVSFQWFWNYVTRNRSARLITGVRAPLAQESLSRG